MVLATRKLPEVLVIVVDGERLSLSKAEWQVRHFMGTQYSSDLEQYLMAIFEEMASTDVLTGDLEGGADWELDDLTGRLNLGSQAKIRGDYASFRETCSMASACFT